MARAKLLKPMSSFFSRKDLEPRPVTADPTKPARLALARALREQFKVVWQSDEDVLRAVLGTTQTHPVLWWHDPARPKDTPEQAAQHKADKEKRLERADQSARKWWAGLEHELLHGAARSAGPALHPTLVDLLLATKAPPSRREVELASRKLLSRALSDDVPDLDHFLRMAVPTNAALLDRRDGHEAMAAAYAECELSFNQLRQQPLISHWAAFVECCRSAQWAEEKEDVDGERRLGHFLLLPSTAEEEALLRLSREANATQTVWVQTGLGDAIRDFFDDAKERSRPSSQTTNNFHGTVVHGSIYSPTHTVHNTANNSPGAFSPHAAVTRIVDNTRYVRSGTMVDGVMAVAPTAPMPAGLHARLRKPQALIQMPGQRKSLDCRLYSQGLARSMAAVVRLKISTAGADTSGTGFFVSPRLIMTSWHVLKDHVERTPEGDAWKVVERPHRTLRVLSHHSHDDPKKEKAVDIGELCPDVFFWMSDDGEQGLDIALVEFKPSDEAAPAPAHIALRAGMSPQDGDPRFRRLHIIGHPRAKYKRLSFGGPVREQRTIDEFANHIYLAYTCDTEGGSSGSPVLNSQWELVAVHRLEYEWPTGGGEQRPAWLPETFEGTYNAGTMANAIFAALNQELERITALLPEQRGTPGGDKLQVAFDLLDQCLHPQRAEP